VAHIWEHSKIKILYFRLSAFIFLLFPYFEKAENSGKIGSGTA